LRAPEMIEILDEFLNRGKLNLLITYQKKLNYYFSRFIEKYL